MLLSPSPFGSRSAIRPRNLPPSPSHLSWEYNRAPRGAQGAFHDPASWLDLETALTWWSADNLDGHVQQPLRPVDQCSLEAAVGEHVPQTAAGEIAVEQDLPSAPGVVGPGRGHE